MQRKYNKYITNSADKTRKIGEDFSKNIRSGDFIALFGELGSGKTTFVQGLASGLGIKKRIISPTFIILRQYKISPLRSPSPLRQGFAGRAGHLRGGKTTFYHVDLYRGNFDGESLAELGLAEIIENKKDIAAVEWSERMKDFLPAKRWEIRFENIGQDNREIIMERVENE